MVVGCDIGSFPLFTVIVFYSLRKLVKKYFRNALRKNKEDFLQPIILDRKIVVLQGVQKTVKHPLKYSQTLLYTHLFPVSHFYCNSRTKRMVRNENLFSCSLPVLKTIEALYFEKSEASRCCPDHKFRASNVMHKSCQICSCKVSIPKFFLFHERTREYI